MVELVRISVHRVSGLIYRGALRIASIEPYPASGTAASSVYWAPWDESLLCIKSICPIRHVPKAGAALAGKASVNARAARACSGRTRPMVRWGWNGRSSRLPHALVSRSMAWQSWDSRSPVPEIPSHTIRGWRALGKHPTPSIVSSKGPVALTALDKAAWISATEETGTSPRKRSVKWICASGIQRTACPPVAAFKSR